MQPRAPARELRVIVVGHGGVGKTCVLTSAFRNVFITEYDPTIEDSYRFQQDVDGETMLFDVLDTAGQEEYNAMQEAYYRTPMLDFMVWVSAMDVAPELDRMRQDLKKFRAVRHIPDNQPLPAFFVLNKFDRLKERCLFPRAEAMALAKELGFLAYYETSCKTHKNTLAVFEDAARIVVAQGPAPVIPQQPEPKKKGLAALFKKKPIPSLLTLPPEQTSRVLHVVGSMAACQYSEADIDEIGLPMPKVVSPSISVFNDLLALYKSGDLTDVHAMSRDGGSGIAVHRSILSIRCKGLQEQLLSLTEPKFTIDFLSEPALKCFLHFLYANQVLIEEATPEVISELRRAATLYALPALEFQILSYANMVKYQHAGLQLVSRPEDTRKSLAAFRDAYKPDACTGSDVDFAIGDRVYHLHRSVLWARSEWFKTLLAERWRHDNKRIEISSFTPQVFDQILEFLYTGSVTVVPEIAQDVLEAANLIGQLNLMQYMEEVVLSALDETTAATLYLWAELHSAKQLSAMCMYYMALHLEKVMQQPSWFQLKAEVTAQVVERNDKLKATRKSLIDMTKMPCLLFDGLHDANR